MLPRLELIEYGSGLLIDDPLLLDSLNYNELNINIFPEFLREGSCWDDFFNPPLVVLGCNDMRTPIFSK